MPKNGREQFLSPAGRSRLSSKDAVERSLSILHNDRARSTAADELLLSRCSGSVRGFRYVDDYELSFATISEAETVLAEVQGVLAEFELILNPRKTRIVELPRAVDGPWASDISRFHVRGEDEPIGQRNDLVALFSMAFDAASSSPEDYVLKFAVARVQNLQVHPKAWRTFQNCLLGTATADSSTFPSVLGALQKASRAGNHDVSKLPLAEACESIILRHAPRQQGSEVAWALWAAAAWDLTLSDATAKAVSEMDDNVVALLALHCDTAGVWSPGGIDPQRWATMVAQPDVLHSENWLLAYESDMRGWIQGSAVHQHPGFSAMRSAGVSFFASSAESVGRLAEQIRLTN